MPGPSTFCRPVDLLQVVLCMLALWVGSARTPPCRAEPSAPAGNAGGLVNFSFDKVDVPTFAKLVGELTGRKFVVADDVKGKITVVSPNVQRGEVYPLFVSILEAAGCSVVRDGDIIRVVSLPKRATPVAPVVGAAEAADGEGVITKILRLDHVSAVKLESALEREVGPGSKGLVAAIDETNHLIVTDTVRSVRRIEKIVREIDQPGLVRATEIVPLEYAGAEDLAARLNRAMSHVADSAEALKKRLPSVSGARSGIRRSTVVASPHSNSLILVGTVAQIAELRDMIEKMDVEARSGRGRLNAIFLKYLDAEEAAQSISALLEKTEKGDDSGPERGRISIEASKANNALLVDAMPGDFDVVRKLVEQLDLMPRQVHIEVIIAELSVTDGLTLGVEMAAVDMPGSIGDTVVQGGSFFSDSAENLLSSLQEGLFPNGISVGVAHGTSTDDDGNIVSGYPGVINIDAIKKDSRFKIRSAPSLVALNNKEATISIVNEIPILESTIEGGAGTARDIIQNIERKEVGIKLKLTPHIIPGGEVQMELNPTIEAILEEGPEGQYTPTIARREVSTTVVVPDGEIIVIGGLTRQDTNRVVERVPILGSIPLLGWLFRKTSDVKEDTNVLVFVTPRIVADRVTARAMSDDMKKKTGLDTHEEK